MISENLITHGDFLYDSSLYDPGTWRQSIVTARGADWAIQNGKATHTAGSMTNLGQSIGAILLHKYRVIWTVSGSSAGYIYPSIMASVGTIATGDGTYSDDIFTIVDTGDDYILFVPSATFAGSISDVSVYEIAVSEVHQDKLDTSWIEHSHVGFTAGTLSSITDLVIEVESKLRRGTLSTTTTPSSTEVQRWLIRGKQELAEIKNFTWTRKYAYADTETSRYRYALPSDYAGGEIKLRDLTNGTDIFFWPSHIFDQRYADPTLEATGEPTAATIKNMELWLIPPPAGIYRLEFEYNRSGDDQTPTDFGWLPEIERFRCCDFAIYQAFRSLHMWEIATLYKQDWMESMSKARKVDSRKKWARMGYQAGCWLSLPNAPGARGGGPGSGGSSSEDEGDYGVV